MALAPVDWYTPGPRFYADDDRCTDCLRLRTESHTRECNERNEKPFGVGSKLWEYDRWGREGLATYVVIGESKVSWCVVREYDPTRTPERIAKFDLKEFRDIKLPKKNGDLVYWEVKGFRTSRLWRDFSAFHDDWWINNHRYAISRAIERIPADKLREVARLIDFKPEAK